MTVAREEIEGPANTELFAPGKYASHALFVEHSLRQMQREQKMWKEKLNRCRVSLISVTGHSQEPH